MNTDLEKYFKLKEKIKARAKEVYRMLQEFGTYKNYFVDIAEIKKDEILIEEEYHNCSSEEFKIIPSYYLFLSDDDIRKEIKKKSEENNKKDKTELQKELEYYEKELKATEVYYE